MSLGVLVAPFEVTENKPMLDMLWRATFRWRIWPPRVTGDSAYGTVENIAAIEKMGISAYVALIKGAGQGRPFFGKDEFAYDPERDHYTCPAGEILVPRMRNARPEEPDRLPGEGRHLRRLPTEARMHDQQDRKADLAPPRRGVRRPGEGVPWDFPLRKGSAQTQGVGRAFVRRSQRLARDEEVPLEGARKGEHRSFTDRLGPEREATAHLREPETEEAGSGDSPAPAGGDRP